MDTSNEAEFARMEQGKKKSGRGSVKNSRRLEAFKNRGGRGGAEWATCDPRTLLAVVDKITGMGGAITFSLSRDKGAHGLTLLLDNEKQTLWFNGDADLTEALQEVIEVLED